MKILGMTMSFVAGVMMTLVILYGRHGGLNETCNRDGRCDHATLTCEDTSPYYTSGKDYRCINRPRNKINE